MIKKFAFAATIGTLLLSAAAMIVTASADSYQFGAQSDGQRHDGCGRAGGMVGSQLNTGRDRVFVAIGSAAMGAVAGNAIARNACRDTSADAYYYNNAYADAFDRAEYGREYRWRNPYTGHYGYVTPMHEPDSGDRQAGPCREFKQSAVIDGQRGEAYGIACRQRDGSWRIIGA